MTALSSRRAPAACLMALSLAGLCSLPTHAQVPAADPAADAAGVQNLRADLRQRMASDMGASLTDALKRRLGVSVDAEVVGTVQ